jgi:hypothetical protein
MAVNGQCRVPAARQLKALESGANQLTNRTHPYPRRDHVSPKSQAEHACPQAIDTRFDSLNIVMGQAKRRLVDKE